MSGAFGWTNSDSGSNSDPNTQNNQGFQSALNAHTSPKQHKVNTRKTKSDKAPKQKSNKPFRDFSRFTNTQHKKIPGAKHHIKSKASNVIIYIQDVTGSMDQWPSEIFKRLPLLFEEACKYMGTQDLEILFIAHGDARTDDHPIQVAHFESGPKLDEHLTSFYTDCGGGGQGTESHELVAYYILTQTDTSSAQNVYTFFVTDEAGCDAIDNKHVCTHLDGKANSEFINTQDIFHALRRRMKIFTILREARFYNTARIKNWWVKTLEKEYVLPLDDPRRVVDVMLGVMAKLTGQINVFKNDLQTRQLPTRYGDQNVDTVMESILLVGKGSPSDPFDIPRNQALLDSPGTRSLLG